MAEPATKPSSLLAPFYPALDGLRAVAFLLVFLHHYGHMWQPWRILDWGWVGVDVFFVLSGFLITGILYDSLHRQDFFRNFYIRRTLRIFPLFYGLWLAILLLQPFLHFLFNRYNLSMAVYAGNFLIPLAKLHGDAALAELQFRHHGQLTALNISPLWSLCVEEQFYLLWPLLVYSIRRRETLLRVCLAVMVLTPLVRCWCVYRFPDYTAATGVYANSLLRFDTLLFGAALALWLRGPAPEPASVRRAAWTVVSLSIALLLACEYTFSEPGTPSPVDGVVSTVGFTLVAAAAAGVLLLAIDPRTRVYGGLRARPLVFLGRLSYGLYVLHGLPATLLAGHLPFFASHHARILVPVLAFLFSLAGAWLSFRFLESPFLKLKTVLAPRPGATDYPETADAPAASSTLHAAPPPR